LGCFSGKKRVQVFLAVQVFLGSLEQVVPHGSFQDIETILSVTPKLSVSETPKLSDGEFSTHRQLM
jgi:hypothetical protein